MTTFNDREKSFEKKFAMDEELKFKAEVAPQQAAGRNGQPKSSGCPGTAVDDYVKAVRKADLAQKGDDDVFQKIKQGPEGEGRQRRRQRAAQGHGRISWARLPSRSRRRERARAEAQSSGARSASMIAAYPCAGLLGLAAPNWRRVLRLHNRAAPRLAPAMH